VVQEKENEAVHMEQTRRQERHQIDYILVKQRFRNSVRDVKTLPGADIDSDHNLLVAEVQARLKSIKNAGKRKQ
jgi:Metal-dependent hydrolase